MNRAVLLLLLSLFSFAFAQECKVSDCPSGTHCEEGSPDCTTSFCPTFTCAANTGSPCQNNECSADQICLPEPKQCPTTPCPQYKCLSAEDYVCATAQCPANSQCIPSPKQCFTTPCPQFDCVPLDDPCSENDCKTGEICVKERKECFTTPCPQYACLSQRECPSGCSKEFRPVCGSDDQTYANLCLLRKAMCTLKKAIYVQYQGECKKEEKSCPSMCTANYEPVCGSDGQTYSNLCGLQQAGCQQKKVISVMHEGECSDCNMACTMEYAPVCADNLHTYPNSCAMAADACQQKTSLSILHKGECQPQEQEEQEECSRFCPMNFAPVCGSDGQTYGNDCMLNVASCQAKGAITRVSQGPCEVECGKVCPEVFAPVCGTNGFTYSNECFFETAKCDSKNAFDLLHHGACLTWQNFAQFDTNNNGRVSVSELENILENPEEAAAASLFYDQNGDGEINKADFTTEVEQQVMKSREGIVGVSVAVALVAGVIFAVLGYLYYKKKTAGSAQKNLAAQRSNKDGSANYEKFNDEL